VWRIEHAYPKMILKSGCLVTFGQPSCRRPQASFVNPHKSLHAGTTCNDALSFAAVMLLHAGYLPTNEWDEVSHLCGVPRCCNIEHLIWEPMDKNFARNLCHKYDQPCTHEPPCIIVAEEEHEEVRKELTKYLSPKRLVDNRASMVRNNLRTSSLPSGAPLKGGEL